MLHHFQNPLRGFQMKSRSKNFPHVSPSLNNTQRITSCLVKLTSPKKIKEISDSRLWARNPEWPSHHLFCWGVVVAGCWPLSPCQQDLGPLEETQGSSSRKPVQHPQGSFLLMQLHRDTHTWSWELRDVVHKSPASLPTEAQARWQTSFLTYSHDGSWGKPQSDHSSSTQFPCLSQFLPLTTTFSHLPTSHKNSQLQGKVKGLLEIHKWYTKSCTFMSFPEGMVHLFP